MGPHLCGRPHRGSQPANTCVVRLSGSMHLNDVLAAFTGTNYRPQLDAATGGDSGETALGKSAP